ncbi:synaptonemal complex protein 2-like [Protopterus annectens]|uniref:synaptonemal complex protein 2-like n=1 Tax=Protopterus annectens TaxID=7888 RepID=UPI001CF9F3BD|nr:synaptonemal complex protein 2-like [Protopterus annectens]
MRAKQELLFEKLIDEALRKDDFHALKEFQQNENDSLSHRCSKQLINKLDKLINRELERKEIKYVSLLLNCLHTFGKNITIQGEDGLNTLMKQGLVQKISICSKYSYLCIIF